jgi:hypothetical protein
MSGHWRPRGERQGPPLCILELRCNSEHATTFIVVPNPHPRWEGSIEFSRFLGIVVQMHFEDHSSLTSTHATASSARGLH